MAVVTPSYGTFSVLDTLRSNFQSVAEIGEDLAYESVRKALDAHNRIVNKEMMGNLCATTTDQQRIYGTAVTMAFEKLDDQGVPLAQKVLPGVMCGFPMDRHGAANQITKNALRIMTGNELAGQVDSVFDADYQNIIRQIKQAIYRPTNYTFQDHLFRANMIIPLPVKAFLNADGANIPVGPNGEIFNGSTHTHYMGSASGTAVESDFQAALNNLLEHYTRGKAEIIINQGQEALVRTFTNFQRYYDATVNVGANITYARGDLDVVQIYNRPIGTLFGATVWVRSWAQPNYAFFHLLDNPPPLMWRNPLWVKGTDIDPLEMEYEGQVIPFLYKAYVRQFGIGVWNRTNGVVLQTNANSYNDPTGTF